MQKSIALRLTAVVWVANIAVTALAVVCLEHPKPYSPPPDVWRPSSEWAAKHVAYNTQAEIAPQASVADEGAPLVMPMDTIVADGRGRAVMQGAPDVVIGPGTVTHPASIPPRRAR